MDIELYIDSKYCGFCPVETIKSYTLEYFRRAKTAAESIDDDEVVIYAIFSYERKNQRFCSADFMTLALPYKRYIKLCSAISGNNRIFFTRKIKGDSK